MAEKATIASAGNNRAYSNGESQEDKYSGGEGIGNKGRTKYEVPPRRDPYTMEVDHRRNCYACGGFGHMACHCRNRGRERLIDGRRVEYRGGRIEEILDNSNNLKGVENLESLN